MSDEEKKALERIDYIQDFIIENGQYNADVNDMEYFSKVLNLIEKQSKEIEEYKKQLDLDNECEIALNSKVMDLKKEIEELKNGQIDFWISDKEIEERIRNKFISKDKIKARIEELEKLDFGTDLVSQFTANLTTITILQSLLEKE